MGSVLSLAISKATAGEHGDITETETSKRQRMLSDLDSEKPRLIPSFPDEISTQILARLPRMSYLNMKLVSKSWKDAVTSPELFQLRKEIGKTEEWLYVLAKNEEEKLMWYALDPTSGQWQRLPPMPTPVCEEETRWGFPGFLLWNVMGSSIKIADAIRRWLGQKGSMEPFCGCGVGAVDGCLYVLGGFSRSSAMRCVLQYDPCLNSWNEVSSMITGRAYCKTGLLNNKLYVVGGVSKGRDGLIPLQSAEVFDPSTGLWIEVPSMTFPKAQDSPTAFLADMIKPIATGMTSYKGRLCVPQSLYSWPFFVDVGGEIYDPETNAWVEMPNGMGEGWPARQAGTKLSVVVNGDLYALDPSSSLESSKIQIYDHQDDAWKVVFGKVPIRDTTDSESPNLLAGFLGKLHVVAKDGKSGIAILQADSQKQLACSTLKSSSLSVEESSEGCDLLSETGSDAWKVIATKSFGSVELVSCQVLDI